MNVKMMNAYIEEVIKRIPGDQKEDIKQELKTLILDYVENEGRTLEEVLIELGDPVKLARKYQDNDKYLIGPNYYERYIKTLQFILPLILGVLIIINSISFLFLGEIRFGDLIGNLFSTVFYIFAYVTIGFMIVERLSRKDYEEEPWHPKDLDLNKIESKSFSKSEFIVQLIFLLIFIVLFNAYPHLIAIHSINEGESVPLFNLQTYSRYVIGFNIAFGLSFTRLFIRLFFDGYTKLYALISVVLNILSTVAIIITLLLPGLLNPTLTEDLVALGFPERFGEEFVTRGVYVIILIMVIITIVECIKDLYYGFKVNLKDIFIKLNRKS